MKNILVTTKEDMELAITAMNSGVTKEEFREWMKKRVKTNG